MTSQSGYLKLLITQSILSGPLDFEIKRVAVLDFLEKFSTISPSFSQEKRQLIMEKNKVGIFLHLHCIVGTDKVGVG